MTFLSFISLFAVLLLLLTIQAKAVEFSFLSQCNRIDSHGRNLASFGKKLLNREFSFYTADSDLAGIPVYVNGFHYRALNQLPAISESSPAFAHISNCNLTSFDDSLDTFTANYKCYDKNSYYGRLFSLKVLVLFDFEVDPTSPQDHFSTRPTVYHSMKITWANSYLTLANSAFSHNSTTYCTAAYQRCSQIPVPACEAAWQSRPYIEYDGVVRKSNTNTCRLWRFYGNPQLCDIDAYCA